MKSLIILIPALFLTLSAHADSTEYYNVGKANKAKPFNCTINLENGETIGGLVWSADGPKAAFQKAISKKSISSQNISVYMLSEEDNDSNLISYEETSTKDGSTKVRILDSSFCMIDRTLIK